MKISLNLLKLHIKYCRLFFFRTRCIITSYDFIYNSETYTSEQLDVIESTLVRMSLRVSLYRSRPRDQSRDPSVFCILQGHSLNPGFLDSDQYSNPATGDMFIVSVMYDNCIGAYICLAAKSDTRRFGSAIHLIASHTYFGPRRSTCF